MDGKTDGNLDGNVTKLKLLPPYIREIPDGKDFKIITPITFKYFVARWINIEQDLTNPFDSCPMKNHDHAELFLMKETERILFIDGYRHLKLSKRDSLVWGGLVKSECKLQVYFYCVSDRFKGKDGGIYQVGFICIKVPNVRTEQLLIRLVTIYHYSGYRTFNYFPW